MRGRADVLVLDPFEAAQAFVSVSKLNMQRLSVFLQDQKMYELLRESLSR